MGAEAQPFLNFKFWFSPNMLLGDLSLKEALRANGGTMVDKCSSGALHVVSHLGDVSRHVFVECVCVCVALCGCVCFYISLVRRARRFFRLRSQRAAALAERV